MNARTHEHTADPKETAGEVSGCPATSDPEQEIADALAAGDYRRARCMARGYLTATADQQVRLRVQARLAVLAPDPRATGLLLAALALLVVLVVVYVL